ncbi:ShdA [Salmonella enterica subsp. enterica serovar Agona str. 400095 18]|nr:ShdA [Salmonella enterica subsp. enterica serovar Agona str. 400095 18]
MKSGDDALTLSGSNTYRGGTTISGGTLVATSVEARGYRRRHRQRHAGAKHRR